MRKSEREEGAIFERRVVLVFFYLNFLFFFCDDLFNIVFNEFYSVFILFYGVDLLFRIPMDFNYNI